MPPAPEPYLRPGCRRWRPEPASHRSRRSAPRSNRRSGSRHAARHGRKIRDRRRHSRGIEPDPIRQRPGKPRRRRFATGREISRGGGGRMFCCGRLDAVGARAAANPSSSTPGVRMASPSAANHSPAVGASEKPPSPSAASANPAASRNPPIVGAAREAPPAHIAAPATSMAPTITFPLAMSRRHADQPFSELGKAAEI